MGKLEEQLPSINVRFEFLQHRIAPPLWIGPSLSVNRYKLFVIWDNSAIECPLLII